MSEQRPGAVCAAHSRGGFTCTLPAGHGGRHVDRGIGPAVTWNETFPARYISDNPPGIEVNV